jgi:hypothetical protein
MLRSRRHRVVTPHGGGGIGSQTVSQSGVGQKAGEQTDQTLAIQSVEQQPISFVLDNLGDAAPAGDDGDQSHAHGFQERGWLPFAGPA